MTKQRNKSIYHFWDKNIDYYNLVFKANMNVNKRLFNILNSHIVKANKVLDIGCGEGSVLSKFNNCQNKILVGIDVSSIAIMIARKKCNNIKFLKFNGSKIPFKNNFFDLVYSTYVLEHIANPEKFINEALRVTNKKGLVIFIFPNYGSLVFKSPCSTEKILPRSKRIIRNYFKNLKKNRIDKLNWSSTEPLLNAPFKPDYDTLCEPDLITLNKFLRKKGCKIITSETNWRVDNFSKKSLVNLMAQILVFILGLFQIPPFKYWGLNAIMVAQKK